MVEFFNGVTMEHCLFITVSGFLVVGFCRYLDYKNI